VEQRTGQVHQEQLLPRHLRRALAHIENFWLPIDTAIHYQVLRLLDDEQASISQVQHELKKDPYLYLYAVRELSRLNVSFQQAHKEHFKKVLDKQTKQISPHVEEEGTDFQKHLNQQLRLELAALLTFAERTSMDLHTSYEAGVLTQLGINLIAWNYPNIFQESINAVRPSQSLVKMLTLKLGFSPLELAQALIEEWQIEDDSRTLMNPSYIPFKLTTKVDTFLERVQKLKDFCDLSHSFSKGHFPELYPSAQKDLRIAREAIAKLLGTGGFDQIKVSYERLMGVQSARLEENPTDEKGRPLASFDPPKIVNQLGRDLRTQFFELYEDLSLSFVRVSLKKITNDILAVSQFNGLCLLTFDPFSKKLVKQFSTGAIRYRETTPINGALSKLAEASLYPNIITLEAIPPHQDFNEARTALFTALQIDDRIIGVIHVEGPFLIHDVLSGNQRNELEAMRIAIEDALILS
jgi:hypothetical protein